jgi:parvulin-like peptidyl-prolyl isomerase
MKGKIVNRLFIFGLLALLLFWVPKLFSESEIILAKVGEVLITQKDLDELINKYTQIKRGKPVTVEEKKMLLDHFIKGTVLAMEAEREKLDQKPDVKSKLKVYRAEVLMQEYANTKIQPLITVTDKEVEERLKENPNLIPKETLTLKEILVKTEKEAEGIYAELKKGKDFSTLASEKSLAPTKIYGGRHQRPVSRGQMSKALEEVAFNLKTGEFSKPIKTDEGYYILSLVDKKERSPEEIKRFEGIIKEKIRNIEIGKKTQEMVENKVEGLKKNIKIETYYDRIQ